ANIDEVEVALVLLGVRWIGDELAGDAAHAHGAERAVPRNVADRQRRARADDAEDVGIVFTVGAEDDGLDLHFVIPTLRKERANRAIREPAGEDFFFRRPTLAFEVAAGKFSGGGGFFAVVNRQ